MNSIEQTQSKDFNLTLSKDWVKQGREFTSILESSDYYGKIPVYWKLTGKDITKKDFESGKIKGSGELKKNGTYKHTFEIARNNDRIENTTLNVAYYFDKKHKNPIANENIRLIAKSYDPSDDPDESWKLTATRINHIKENVAVRAHISNGKPGKIIFFKLTGKGLDQNDLDLSYGRMSGRAIMDDDGYTVIPFLIRADHKTEGTETLKFSFYKDENYKKKYSSFSLEIYDESIETPEQGPTLSPIPSFDQPTWSGPTEKGTWFTIAPSRSAIQENQSSRTKINSNSKTGNVLYFKITGNGIDKDDFDLNYARTSGSIVINKSGSAFIPQLLINDYKTEGVENMVISLYRDKKYKNLVATSTVPIEDTSIETPDNRPTSSEIPEASQPQWGGGVDGGSWFTLSPGRAEYTRGEEIGIRIDSDSLPGTKLIWELTGTGISAEDIEASENTTGLSGTETIKLNGTGGFKVTFKPDNQTKDDKLITFNLYKIESKKTKLASTSLILEATPAEALPNKLELNEGESNKFKIITKGVAAGEKIFWDVSGINITDDDFDTPRSGVTTLDSTRKFQVNLETRKDLLTEGTEYFRLNIYSDEAKTDFLASSDQVTIFDTSTTPPVEALPNKNVLDEGKSLKFKIFTKGMLAGDTVFWDVSGLNITDGDFVTPRSGTTTLDSTRKFQVNLETRKDLLTEGTEYFRLNLYSDEAKSERLTSSEEITIFDTSITPVAIYGIEPSVESVQEGKSFKVKVKTKNISSDQIIHWKGSGPAADENIVYLEGSDSMHGVVPLDSKGNSTFHFKTIKNQMMFETSPFNFTLFENEDLLDPVIPPITVTIMEK